MAGEPDTTVVRDGTGGWAARSRYLAHVVDAEAVIVSIVPNGSLTTYAAHNIGAALGTAETEAMQRALATSTVVAVPTQTVLGDGRIASSLCAAPVTWEGRRIGVIGALRVGRGWEPPSQSTVARCADLVALELAETHARTWWRRCAEAWQRRVTLIERLREDLLPLADDPPTFFDAAAERIASLAGATGASLMLLNSENELVVRSAYGPHRERARDARRRLGEGISGWVAKHAQPLLLHGRVHDARFDGVDPTIDESLVVPLRLGERVVGVISTRAHRVPDANGDDRLKDLDFVAREMAMLLARAEERTLRLGLTERLENDRREAVAMYDLARLAGIGADPEADLGGAVELIAEAFDHDAVAIWTIDVERALLVRRATRGFGEVVPGDLLLRADPLVTELLATQRPRLLTAPHSGPFARFGLESVILAPVIVDSDSCGLLLLGRRDRGYEAFDFGLAATIADILSALVRREITTHAVQRAEVERRELVLRMQEEFSEEMSRVVYVLDACQRLLGQDSDLPTDLARAARDARSALERVGVELGRDEVASRFVLPRPDARLLVLEGGERSA